MTTLFAHRQTLVRFILSFARLFLGAPLDSTRAKGRFTLLFGQFRVGPTNKIARFLKRKSDFETKPLPYYSLHRQANRKNAEIEGPHASPPQRPRGRFEIKPLGETPNGIHKARRSHGTHTQELHSRRGRRRGRIGTGRACRLARKAAHRLPLPQRRPKKRPKPPKTRLTIGRRNCRNV